MKYTMALLAAGTDVTGAIHSAMENKTSTEYMGLTIWDRPGAKAADSSASLPRTQEQLDAQVQFGKRLHELLQEGINDGSACAFLTPSENGKTLLVAATIPVPPLVVRVEDGETITTNKWALNLNVAIPKESKEAQAPTSEPRPAMSLTDLRKFIAKNRQTAK